MEEDLEEGTTEVVEAEMVRVSDFRVIVLSANYVANSITVHTCYHRYDPHFQGQPPQVSNAIPYSNILPPPPSTTFHQPKTYLAAATNNSEGSWFANSGATHHVTAEQSNILQHSYNNKGLEQLYVGNGKGVTKEMLL
ncbi:hypothetical protein PIB30_080616 [Stylosanthes scabra]|uniref:Uncharacterized protein n=1 Tax=Stylosanthes scabra TaxID=79078 RepID=A0ABU6ZQ94_9FABA|nr:hypothetical protein [Stylosanthes scabra]